jgi:hypothetical protein
VQVLDDGTKSQQRIADGKEGQRRAVGGVQFAVACSQGGGDDEDVGAAVRQVAKVALVLHKGDVVRPGLVERPGGVEAEVGVAMHLPVDQRRQLPDGDAHAIPLYVSPTRQRGKNCKVGKEAILSERW